MPATRDSIIKELELRLGYGLVDVELDPEHYNLAITKALEKYRQRSENAVIEQFIHLRLEIDRTDYTLPDDVVEVMKVYRRSTSLGTTSGNDFEPFEAQFLNSFLLNSGRAGGLAVYDALAQHRELLARFFGAELNFTWNNSTKNLFIHRRMRADDDIFVHTYQYRPEENLFNDTYAAPWLKDYAFAMSKLMLAEGRGKYSTIAGPQGGTTLNAEALRSDAAEEIKKLEDQLTRYSEGSEGLGFIIG